MKITVNGDYAIQSYKAGQAGGTSVVMLSGTSGDAVCTLGYYDDYNNFIPLNNGLATPNNQYYVTHGADVPLFLKVTSAGVNTTLSLLVNGKV